MSTLARETPHCILHIGMPKTGSSSIQQTFCGLVSNEQFHYLELGESGNHSVLIYSLFSKDPASYHAHVKANRSAVEISKFNGVNFGELKKAMQGVRSENVIISGEDIMFLDANELLELKKFLFEYVSSIQVIAYIRPPISFMQSAFQQNVKEGDLRFGISEYRPQYRNWFEKFDSVFGRENVLLVKFDPASLFGGDVVSDFSSRVGVIVEPQNYIRTNESITLEAVAMLYVFHRLCPERTESSNTYKNNQILIAALSKIGTRKLKFSSTLSRTILGTISADVKWMELRLGVGLTESLPDSDGSISSEEDLIAIALECSDDLIRLISEKIRLQLVTPQAMADWIRLLRNQLSIDPIFSKKQIERLESTSIQPSDMLKELVLSLSRVGYHKAAGNIQAKLAPLLQAGFCAPTISTGCEANLQGSIDVCIDRSIMGWALDNNRPSNKLAIEISQAQRIIASGIADQFRQDLADAGVGDGFCAFVLKADIDPAEGDAPLVLRVIEFKKEFQVRLRNGLKLE